MPAKTASQPMAANVRGRKTDSTISRSTASSRTDDWDSGVEGPARKRIQKSTSNNSMTATRKPDTHLPPTIAAAGDARVTRRRQSSIPNGPRPLNNTGKRNVTNPYTASNPSASVANNTTTSVPHKRTDSINNTSRFSFASITTKGPSKDEGDNLTGEFLPNVSFDDFHESITSTSPQLGFTLAGQNGDSTSRPGSINETSSLASHSSIPAPTTSTTRKASANVSRNTSLVRRQSNASSTISRQSSTSESIQTAGPTIRARRQSHFPPSSFHNLSTTTTSKPRKSVGPGVFVPPESTETNTTARRQSIGRRTGAEAGKQITGLTVRTNTKELSGNARTVKAKSMQPPPRAPADSLLSPSKTPQQHSRSPSTNSGRTPGKNTASARSSSPTSSSKRASMMPHATGLGARTISPTDARRMKRMSVMPSMPSSLPSGIPAAMPTAPQMPQTPTTPSEPLLPPPRTFAQSPAQVRKSVTPSSSRTTPDPNRKSYSSGQSLSSSTSYNSIRNSVGPTVPRLATSASSSRLTTPKPRLDSSAFPNGDVPPVPAIPKAYESPQSELEQPFMLTGSLNLASADAPLDSPLAESFSGHSLNTPTESINSSRKSSLVPDPEPRKSSNSSTNKKNLQPLRLPPLNLLPLSTPTASRIKSFDGKSGAVSPGTHTPPPRNLNAKTPSTPMTASKASFFSRPNHESDTAPIPMLRASSSHFTLRSEALFRAESSISANLPYSFEPPPSHARNMSPFISSSLPKNSGEFPPYMQPKLSGEFTRPIETHKIQGPRAPSMSMKSKEDLISPGSSQSSFSTTSIRRKLSLTRKRSTSKSQDPPKVKVSENAKYDNMPPPKLPASATWNNLASTTRASPSSTTTATTTTAAAKPTYLKSRRKSSVTNISVAAQSVEDLAQSFLKVEPRRSTDSNRSFDTHPNRSSSLFLPVQAAPPPKPSTHLPRALEPNLDRDDLVAEDEMKKLAAKRKDFESAGRELDALRDRASAKDPVSSTQAMQSVSLNIFERGEIVDYKHVYFTGTRTAKKLVGDLSATSVNFGYDDERGDYNIVIGDHLAYRYEVVDILGKGSFGQVVRCIDHKTGILVAVKIIRNKKRFHQQALVEVNILKKLREWDPDNRHSCVNFDQNFYFRGHLCISTNLLGMNLYEFIKAHDFRGFSLKLIRRFTKQMLATLVLLHTHKVIHCDLKPENILLAHPMHSEIKVIDFGASCFENEKVYTYVQSRFYRSPEVILGMSYGMPIDMWSLGCILAELYTGYPIFPGENEQEQLACIMEIFGPPERHLIEKSTRKKLFFDSMGKPRLTVSSKGRRRRPSSKDLRQVLKCDDEAFLDFITKCLRWDPARRMSPHEAAVHEFITGFKPTARTRGQTLTAATPAKRVTSATVSSNTRPLPQPPATALKTGTASRTVDNTNSTASPAKSTQRRQSTVNNLQTPSTVKRVSHAASATAGSALPRVPASQRITSSKPDMATAAAVTSLKSR